jgi:hypothetical protein
MEDDAMGEARSTHGEMRSACRILVGTLKGRRDHSGDLGEDESNRHIKMDGEEIGCESFDWPLPVQDMIKWLAVVNAALSQ